MKEAQFDPKKHVDRYGLAAELEAQDVQVDWNTPGGPTVKRPINYAYDWRTQTFRIVQE